MTPMIAVTRLGKRYKRYHTRWGRIGEWLSAGHYVAHEPRWALRDISFAIGAGEAVGIIGQNGAGKSTLLKILTGTTQPSEGSARIGGRAAALLELGMGFHPDFTGRQNAVIGCQMLGLRADAIRDCLPAIAAFAELPDYMDQPLRSYSTGMQMRLAFSVATAARPEILIVDEALSVGDAYFQHKAIQRIRTFVAAGTTLLFVSHDPLAVKSLCQRALLLDGGRLVHDGTPLAVLDYYNALIATKERDAAIRQIDTGDGATSTRSGSGVARIAGVELLDAGGRPTRAFRSGDAAVLASEIAFSAAVERPTVGILIRDRLGNDVFGTNTHHLGVAVERVAPDDRLYARFALRLNLGEGHYAVSIAVHTGDSHLADHFDWWDHVVVFEVLPGPHGKFVGTAMLPVDGTLEKRPARTGAPAAGSLDGVSRTVH